MTIFDDEDDGPRVGDVIQVQGVSLQSYVAAVVSGCSATGWTLDLRRIGRSGKPSKMSLSIRLLPNDFSYIHRTPTGGQETLR